MTCKARELSGAEAVLLISQLTRLRTLRSKSFWIALGFAGLPLVAAAAPGLGEKGLLEHWKIFLGIALGMLALIPPILMAPAIAEEVSEKTYTYLWSRPFPRWAVLVGKILAGLLLSGLVMAASIGLGYLLIKLGDPSMLGRAMLAGFVGTVSVGVISASLGTLLPKHPLALSITYFLLFDGLLGAIPIGMAKLSVQFHALQLAGIGDGDVGALESILWLTGLTGVWLILALRRLTRKELSTVDE